MFNFTKKQQIIVLILIVAVFTIVGMKIKSQKDIKEDDEFEEISLEEFKKENSEEQDSDAQSDENIVVYIKGAVKNPGIIRTESNKRIMDIVELAGGFQEGVDLNRINLAKKVMDEDMIHIPYQGEEIDNTGADMDEAGIVDGSSDNTGGKVNINTASKEELKTLSGIGEVTSEKIINHRSEEKFNTIEDIKKVSGIGDKKFEAIKDSIVVN